MPERNAGLNSHEADAAGNENRGPDLTVVIATFDRAGQCLVAIESVRSVAAVSGLTIEIIVIEQGNEQQYPVPDDFAGTWLFTTYCSTSHARNAGLDRAGADVVIFLDDDGELLPGAIEVIERHATSGNSVTMGRIVWIGDETADQTAPATTVTPYNLFKFFLECGTVWDVAALRQVNGFDERFGPPNDIGSEEGAEAIGRIASHVDKPVRFEPVDMVKHPSLKRLPLHKARRYGRGAGALLPLSPSWWTLRYWSTIGIRRSVGMLVALATGDRHMFKMRLFWLGGFASGVVHGVRAHRMPAHRPADLTVIE